MSWLDGVGVVGVDPEREPLGAREARGVEGREAPQVAGEGGRRLEGVVVYQAARDVGAQALVERGVMLGSGRGRAEANAARTTPVARRGESRALAYHTSAIAITSRASPC